MPTTISRPSWLRVIEGARAPPVTARPALSVDAVLSNEELIRAYGYRRLPGTPLGYANFSPDPREGA